MGVNFRIVSAFVLGLGMVGSAWLWRPDTSTDTANGNLPTPTAIRTFISVKDSDGNSIPDWQESFARGTIDLNATNTNATTTRTGMLASALAYELITGDSTSEEVLQKLSGDLNQESIDEQYTESDIKISTDNGQEAWRHYGNQVAIIANAYPLPEGTPNELDTLHQAFLRNDPSSLAKLEPSIAAYDAMVKDMLALSVPSSLTKEHLSLINVYVALHNDLKAFRQAYEDSLPAVLRFRRYPADAGALYTAISNLYVKLDESGIQWSDTDEASKFIEIP